MTNLLDTILPDLVADIFPALTGQDVILRHTAPGTYDPETGTQDADVVTDYPVTSVSPLTAYDVAQVDGTAIQSGDASISLPATALSVVPDPTEYSLVIDSEVWKIASVMPVRTGAATALYTLQVRQ